MEKTIIIEKDRFKNVNSWINYFNALTWLTRARATDETRRNLGMISVQDGFLCCTDEHRLHVYTPDLDELPAGCVPSDGLWEVRTVTKKQIVLTLDESGEIFPDYWRILNYKRHNGIKPLDMSFGRDVSGSLTRFSYHINTSTEKMINLDYIKDAMMEGYVRFETNADAGPLGPIYFGNGDQLAVIMPLKQ